MNGEEGAPQLEQPIQQEAPVQRGPQIEEEEIPETKLSALRQSEIYNEFKISIRNQNFDKVQELLVQYQKELDLANRIDPQSRQISSYLGVVIPEEEQALKMVQLLAEHGCNLRFKDQMKQSILFYASRDGKAKVLEYLIKEGIDVNEIDLYGQTPLYYAARDNRLDFVRRMIDQGCDLNHVDGLSSQTALFYAAREGHIEMCKMLMDNGCKPQHQDSTRKTALFYAKKNNKKDVVDLINSYSSRTKEDKKEPEQVQGKKKKKEKEIPKQSYKLVFTDDQGNQKELTEEDFQNFQRQFPEVAQMLMNADEMIDEEMIQSIKEEESWEKVAKKVLTQIWKAKGAYFFHQPVDPKKYGIDDYFEIVKKPMDFGTIKNKLHQNVYRSCAEFVDDVEQVFKNCLMYNGTETDVGKIGVSTHEEFKQLKNAYNLHKYIKQTE